MAGGHIVQEDGASKLLLEDGSGSLVTEDFASGGSGGIRGANAGGVSASSSSVVVSFSAIAGIAAGDTARFAVGWNFNGTTVNTPSGWTLVTHPTGTSGSQMAVFEKTLTSGDISAGSVTVTFSAATRVTWAIAVYAGTVTFGTPVTAVGNATLTTAGNVTTTSPGSDVLTFWTSSPSSPPAVTLGFANGTLDAQGKTSIASGTQTTTAVGHLTTTTTGSYTAGAVSGASGAGANQYVTFEVIGAGGTPGAGTTTYTMVGGARSDRALVLAKTAGATSVQIGYSTSPTMTSPTFTTAAAPDSNDEYRVDITGLAADTPYYYQVFDTPSGGSQTSISDTRTFRTRTSASAGASLKVVLGSCCLTATTQSTAAFPSMVAWDPHYFLHLGDAYYNGNGDTTAPPHRAKWEAQLAAVSDWNDALAGVAVEYINSDHELNPDDVDTDTTAAAAFNLFYKQTIPARLVDTASTPVGKYRSWIDYADGVAIRFILLDVRNTDRSPGANTDDSSKTMLGATQKAWLKNELLDSDGTATVLKVIISDVPWSGTPSLANGVDKWWSYSTERQELADFITGNGVAVDFWHGDSHRLGVDATHNAWGGFPVVCGSPFSQNAGGHETEGFWDEFYSPGSGTTPVSNYMRITFDSPSPGVLRRTASGWDAINDVEQVSQVVQWITGSLATTLDGATLAATGTETITGTLTSTLAGASLAGTGSQVISGTFSTTLDGATLAGSGSETISGTLATTLDGVTLAGAGTETITGTLATSLDGAALAGTGTEAISGTLATTLDGATLAADGGSTSPGVTGTLAATLDGATLNAAGTETVAGSITITLADALLTASGTVSPPVTGTLATTLDGATLAATGAAGTPPVTGTLATTLDGATLSAIANETMTGVLLASLEGATLTATAEEVFTGVLASTLDDTTLAAAGAETIDGTADLTLDGVTFAAIGTVVNPGLHLADVDDTLVAAVRARRLTAEPLRRSLPTTTRTRKFTAAPHRRRFEED